MRIVRSVCSVAVLATAFGCGGGSDQSGKGAQAPTTEGTSPETAGQMPPAPSEPGTAAPPGGGTMPAQPTPGQPGAGPQGQMLPTSSELVESTLLCALGPVTHGSGSGSNLQQGSMQQGSMQQGSMQQGTMGGSQGGALPSQPPPAGMGTGGTGTGSGMTGGTGTGSTGQVSSGMGPGATSCTKVAQAANVSPLSLYNTEPTAVESVRRLIDSRAKAEGMTTDLANNQVAFFDKGVAATREARVARMASEAVASQAAPMGSTPSSRSAGGSSTTGQQRQGSSGQSSSSTTASPPLPGPGTEELRAHRALSDLYEFGRTLGTTDVGTEAQALSWIIGVSRFFMIGKLPPQQRALAAEPLFSAILDVPPPAATSGRTTSFSDYLAAAARSVGATSSGAGGTPGRAVGGGPSAGNESANLQEVARASEERLQVLGQQLPASSALRSEVDRTVVKLRVLESQAATLQPSPSTQPKPGGTTTPKKPPPQPTTPSK